MLDLFNINKNFYIGPGGGGGSIVLPETITFKEAATPILNYIAHTPDNVNFNILRDMLRNFYLQNITDLSRLPSGGFSDS